MPFERTTNPHATGKLVRFDNMTWAAIQETAKAHDMTANYFVPLVMRNYLAKRWPLELIPEPGPKQ